jgi:hypothetical protein
MGSSVSAAGWCFLCLAGVHNYRCADRGWRASRDGKFGLWMDADLEKGFSARCPAFANEVLCESENSDPERGSKFEVLGVEVWGVGL